MFLQTIQAVQPDVVLVELCKSRVDILKYDEEFLLREAENIDMQKLKLAIKQVSTTHFKLIINNQGSKKTPSGRLGQVDFPFGQVTYSPSLPHGQGPRQAVCQLNFGNDFEKKSKVIKCLDEE